jgi:hypothetical protein
MVKLPKDDYFKSGNPYSGSKTTENDCFNYFVEYREKYICKTWNGLLNSETAEDIVLVKFEHLEDVCDYLEKQFNF